MLWRIRASLWLVMCDGQMVLISRSFSPALRNTCPVTNQQAKQEKDCQSSRCLPSAPDSPTTVHLPAGAGGKARSTNYGSRRQASMVRNGFSTTIHVPPTSTSVPTASPKIYEIHLVALNRRAGISLGIAERHCRLVIVGQMQRKPLADHSSEWRIPVNLKG